MANKKVAWSGKSYGGYWGTLAFISLLKIGLVPAYGLLVFVAAFFILFRRRAVAPICAYLSKIFGCRVPTISLSAYKSVFRSAFQFSIEPHIFQAAEALKYAIAPKV